MLVDLKLCQQRFLGCVYERTETDAQVTTEPTASFCERPALIMLLWTLLLMLSLTVSRTSQKTSAQNY